MGYSFGGIKEFSSNIALFPVAIWKFALLVLPRISVMVPMSIGELNFIVSWLNCSNEWEEVHSVSSDWSDNSGAYISSFYQ